MKLYLSRLILAENRIASLWVSNPYRVHQRLMMACEGDPRLLFRIEKNERQTMILAQTQHPPIWEKAFSDFDVLSIKPETKEFEPKLMTDENYHFRLLANPSIKRDGKRLGIIKEEDQLTWLTRKIGQSGAELQGCMVQPNGIMHSSRNPRKDESQQSHLAVLFDGLLQVKDPEKVAEVIANGIGSAKGYGFGLLSLAR
jgi:CRISPR system Cascade subunit CasE